jgi:Tfp pilus assembly protein PilN
MNFHLKTGLDCCSGIEIKIGGDDTYEFKIVTLSIEGQLVNIDSKKQYTGTLEKLPFTSTIPVSLSFTGSGVLIKKTQFVEVLSDQVLQNLFPGLKIKEFYVQNFHSGEFSFVSVIRLEIIEKVLNAFKGHKILVLMVSLGPFAVDYALPLLNVYNQSVYFDGHQVKLDEQKSWVDYQYKMQSEPQFVLKIENEEIPETYLLSYASSFQLLLCGQLTPIELDLPVIEEDRNEYFAKLKFEKKGVLFLAILFVMLLINFLMLSYFDKENETMQGRAGSLVTITDDRDKIIKDLQFKEDLIKKLKWNKGLKYAYICDQIGKKVPGDIILTGLIVNAAEESLSQVQASTLNNGVGTISIKGRAKNVYGVNDLIYQFQRTSWIKEVKLGQFSNDEQSGMQLFTLQLKY